MKRFNIKQYRTNTNNVKNPRASRQEFEEYDDEWYDDEDDDFTGNGKDRIKKFKDYRAT
jgi:hypothetical protein